jgi:hypothetical protein
MKGTAAMSTAHIETEILIVLIVKLGWSHWAGNLWSKGEYIMTFEDAIAFELTKATGIKA